MIIIVKRYNLVFVTIDGAKHRYTVEKFINEKQGDFLELAMEENFLQDDNGVLYPIYNILSIQKELVCSKETEKEYSWDDTPQIWYD